MPAPRDAAALRTPAGCLTLLFLRPAVLLCLSSVARFLFVSLCSDIFSSFFGGGFGVQIQTHWGRVRHSHSGKAKGWDECSLALLISVFCGLVCFQAQGGRGRGKPTRTPDVQHQVGLTLQDFYRGRTKKLKGQRGMRRAQWVAAAQCWKLHFRMRISAPPVLTRAFSCSHDFPCAPLSVQRQVLCVTCKGKGSQKEGAVQKCTGWSVITQRASCCCRIVAVG